MNSNRSIGQRNLRRVICVWGDVEREHQLLLPLFGKDHKVRGLIGFSAQAPPVWYPEIPVMTQGRRMGFKSAYREHPPPWEEVERDLFEGCYYFDIWSAMAGVLPTVPGAPSIYGSVNLARARLLGRPILDVFFEPQLHRVRTLLVRERWWRKRHYDVLMLPAFAEAIDAPAAPDAVLAGLAGAGSGYDMVPMRAGWLLRMLRDSLAKNKTKPPAPS